MAASSDHDTNTMSFGPSGGSKIKRERLEAELKEVEGEYKEGETLRQVQMWPVTGSESWSASLAL